MSKLGHAYVMEPVSLQDLEKLITRDTNETRYTKERSLEKNEALLAAMSDYSQAKRAIYPRSKYADTFGFVEFLKEHQPAMWQDYNGEGEFINSRQVNKIMKNWPRIRTCYSTMRIGGRGENVLTKGYEIEDVETVMNRIWPKI